MVKISLKKESKVKKQKQKQKQSQKVVVNIGTNVLKSKRRRKASGPIEKKAINKQQTPTTINVPQALSNVSHPPNSMSEFVKYLKESERQKEKNKENEKKPNELEKEKKEENRSKDLTKEEVQDNFSNVFTTSKLPPSYFEKPIAFDTVFSKPKDYETLFEKIKKEVDLRDGNPNTGNLSFADAFAIPFAEVYVPPSTSIFNEPKKATLDDILQNTVVTDAEDPVIEQVLEEMPENKIVIYGPERAGQTATATEQIINPIDNSIPPPPPFRFNKPLPTIRMADIIAANAKPLSLTQISQKEKERESRLKAFESKKPLLIEAQTTQVDEDESKNKSYQGDSPELREFKDLLKGLKNKDMGNLLIKNNIKGPNGKNYTVNKSGVNIGSKSASKQYLSEALLQAFNEGKIAK